VTACSSTPAQQPAPWANLNHFYLVVDEETADAIGTSDALGHFAFRREDDPDEPGRRYAGRYLYGYRTYVEFFDPDRFDLNAEEPARLGLFGIAVGGDRLGDLDRVADVMNERGVAFERSMRTFTTRDGQELPDWEKLALEGAADDENHLWAMQYQPELMAFIREISDSPAIRDAAPDLVSRAIYNEWRHDPDRLLRDVTGLTAVIGATERSAFEAFFGAAGFVIEPTPRGFTALGNDVSFDFEVSDEVPSGITEIAFSLTRSPEEPSVHDIGNSRLTVGPGPTAVWRFRSGKHERRR
jgi:hypothetical protein